MPIGSIEMSDARAGAVPPSAVTLPAALQRPYDGGPAFKSAEVGTTRFSHVPAVVGKQHLEDKIQIVSDAEPPKIATRSAIGTTRTGARGRKQDFYGSGDPHICGALANTTLSSYLGEQANGRPGSSCIAGSARKRFDWNASYGLRSAESVPRGKAMNSVNGRSVYARDQYSYPRKKVVEQPDRQPRKGPSAHLVTLANGGEVEDLGRRHFDQSRPPNRVPDAEVQRGKFADFPIKPTTESNPDTVGKMGSYSVFDMIGRKRPDPGKWEENANSWPATKEYGPSHDAEGFPIDYSITEHGGPFRRPTIYHNDFRLEKSSTYGEVLPPGHSTRFPPGTSESVLRAQRIPQVTNTRSALGDPLVGVAPEMGPAPTTGSRASRTPPLGSPHSAPPPESVQAASRSGGSSGLVVPTIYFGSENKSYNKGAEYTHSCATRAGTPPTQAPPPTTVRYKATEDGEFRKRATITGVFRP